MPQGIRDLLDRRARLWDEAQAIHDTAAQEDRDITQEESERGDRLIADVRSLTTQIEQQRALAELRLEIEGGGSDDDARNGGPSPPPTERVAAVNRAFRSWMGFSQEGPSQEDRQVLREAGIAADRPNEVTIPLLRRAPRTAEEARAGAIAEERALAVGTDSAGGFTVATEFRRAIEVALLTFGGMRRARTTVIRTSTGGDLEVPTSNDTSNAGAILAENTVDTEQDVVFGQLILGAFKYTSKIIRVPIELIQDSAFDIGAFLAERLGERIGRIHNTHFTVGTGTGQPRGAVTASTLGKTGTTGQTTTVIYADLVDLMIAVDESYRMNGEWMFSDSTLGKLMKLLDADNRPLWQPGLTVAQPDQILGKRYIVNNDVPNMAANAKSILFGDFSKYWIRDVLDITVRRLVERYADFHQEAFVAIARSDGDLLDAGTNPIKHYANSAT